MIVNNNKNNYFFQNNAVVKNHAESDVLGTEKVSSENMTMGEYKKYIYDKISDISVYNGNLTEVSISEEGFKAMKNNPEYEKWVMSQISVPSGDKDSYNIYYVGSDRNSLRLECWKPEDMEKRRKREEKEKEFWKLKRKKEMEAKIEHYAQYKRMLQENSIRKAEIELNHISGIYDDYQKTSTNLNAAASYKAIMNSSSMGTDEKQSGSVSVNVEKRSRQIASAKTSEQIKVILQMLRADLTECKAGLQKGWCDENEASKAEELIRKAEEKQSELPTGADGQENEDNSDMSFMLNMIM